MLKVTFQPSPLFSLYPLALLFYKASPWRTCSSPPYQWTSTVFSSSDRTITNLWPLAGILGYHPSKPSSPPYLIPSVGGDLFFLPMTTFFQKENERKSEQAHIPHAPTLLENAVYNERQVQALGTGNQTKKGI